MILIFLDLTGKDACLWQIVIYAELKGKQFMPPHISLAFSQLNVPVVNGNPLDLVFVTFCGRGITLTPIPVTARSKA
jgi:hypothetical protein